MTIELPSDKQLQQTQRELAEIEEEQKKDYKEFGQEFLKLLDNRDYEGVKALFESYQEKLDKIGERIEKLRF